MTKVSLLRDLKNILMNNIYELNRNTRFEKLFITFRGGKFYVKIDKNNKIIHKGNLLDLGLDFESQKKFIFDVLNKLTSFVKDYWKNEEKLLLSEDDCNKIYVVGCGYIYKNNFIKLNSNYKNVINEIKYKLLGSEIIVVYCKDKKGFYVDGLIYEDEICLKCINDLNNVIGGYDNGNVTLYYKIATDKEIKKAIKFIEKLVKNKKERR